MFSVNGIALDNPTAGWWLDAETRTMVDGASERESIVVPGVDGVYPLVARATAPVWPLTMIVQRTKFEELSALFYRADSTITYTAAPSKYAAFTTLNRRVESENYAADGSMRVTFIVQLDRAYWRDSTLSTTANAISTASVAVSIYTGISAPVQDAIVRVRGSITGLQVTDSGGSWFSYAPNIPSGSYLRFDLANGRAYIFTSDIWSGANTEVSGLVDFGGPRGFFELTPYFTDPLTRQVNLTVASTSRSGAQIEVRGRSAYVG